jgi:hypothetical protein
MPVRILLIQINLVVCLQIKSLKHIWYVVQVFIEVNYLWFLLNVLDQETFAQSWV